MDQNVYDVIIIGAGFCGISCGAGLKTFGVNNFIILEKGDCCGYFWKTSTYDRLHLHTPYHDLPHDKGLVYSYPKYKSSQQLISYLNAYTDLHQLSSKIQFNSNVININKSINSLWSITYTNHLKPEQAAKCILSRYLVIATSIFRSPSIPNNLQQTMKHFNGEIIHSIQYKNASKYKNKNMLIIGNGNSACEICIDAVEYDVNKITIVSRRPRHFIPLKTYEKHVFRKMIVGKYLGKWDSLHRTLFRVTKTHRKYNEIMKRLKKTSDIMSMDLSEYGIVKPVKSNAEETVEGNYEVIDIGFIPLLKNGRIEVVNKGGVKAFDGDNICMENGEILSGNYDVVVLCTGFQHGLERLFDKSIFNKYFYDGTDGNKCKLYTRYNIFPKTDGQNCALEDDSLYFAGFDACITGGLSRGLWGWQIARQISKNEKKYNKNMELSDWNYMNTLVVTGVMAVIGSVGAVSWYFWKHRKRYIPSKI